MQRRPQCPETWPPATPRWPSGSSTSASEAEDWVSALLKDPQTSSAIGWVRHGNVVVAGPLNAAPEVSAALGTGSQIY